MLQFFPFIFFSSFLVQRNKHCLVDVDGIATNWSCEWEAKGSHHRDVYNITRVGQLFLNIKRSSTCVTVYLKIHACQLTMKITVETC